MNKIRLISLMIFLSPCIPIHGQVSDSLIETLATGMTPSSSVDEGRDYDEEESANDELRMNNYTQDFEDANYGYTGSKNFLSAPTEKYIEKPLSYFGYDFFTDVPSTFASSENIPIPPDYIIGPQDGIRVILFGNKNITYNLKVSRDGEIFFPEIGPVVVAGLSFLDLEEIIQDLVSNKFIGTQSRVTLDKLRSINIFVLGEALQPGMYTVSSLSSLTNAILRNGGVKITGSLRNIELKRKGETITSFDAYDLLLNGDTTNDVRLMEGDVVFIPSIGKTLGIDGEVNRPGIYELQDDETLLDLLNFSGGLKPKANKLSADIRRISPLGSGFDLISVDLSEDTIKNAAVNNGDVITVYPVPNSIRNAVLLKGHAQQPGFYAWNNGMRISDIINSTDDLLTNTDLGYMLIKRKEKSRQGYRFLQVNLESLFNASDSAENISLSDQDELILFPSLLTPELITTRMIQDKYILDKEKNRMVLENEWNSLTYLRKSLMEETIITDDSSTLTPLMDNQGLGTITSEQTLAEEIKRYYEYTIFEYCTIPEDLAIMVIESSREEISKLITDSCRKQLLEPLLDLVRRDVANNSKLRVISVFGNVHFPGTYPFTNEMLLADALDAAGGSMNATYHAEIELTRINNTGKEFIVTNNYQSLNSSINTPLENMDVVNLKQIGTELKTVEISGEVFFPGIYPISDNQTLSDLVRRAGGITESGSMEAAFFQRASLKTAESERLKNAQDELRRKILLSSQTAGLGEEKLDSKAINQLNALLELDEPEAEALGRLVIDLSSIMSGQLDDVTLEDGDTIRIPKRNQSISVIGEVFVSNSHIFEKNLRIEDYINLSGGTTNFADEGNVYLIKSDGSIISPSQLSSGFFRGSRNTLQPGDTIVVPLELESFSGIKATIEITQIIYQMALAAAAVNSF